MSLKSFHVLLISVFLGFCAYLGYWLLKYQTTWAGADGALPAGFLMAGAILALAAGIPYLGWFLKKSKLP
ncbi:MAG: hypothetical protein HY547_06765 [Elusimicrobia bacterium]|nr:hypothetical protein [Elusimicrobiota bacterium]